MDIYIYIYIHLRLTKYEKNINKRGKDKIIRTVWKLRKLNNFHNINSQ